MVSTPPNPVDVVDFQFKELCRLKVFESDDNFPSVCNLVTVASRFGLIFIGTNSNEFQVIQVKDIEEFSKEVPNFKRRIVVLPSRTLHLSVNCDCTKLAVVITKDNCPHIVFYDVLSFLKQNIQIINHTRLSPSPTCKVLAVDWNPALSDVFTACKDDGTLLLYEFKGSPLELPAGAGATCFCWSPKGKQLAVGSRDGKITQYKIDLKAVKVTEAPTGFTSISSLCWLSSFQFAGIYDDAAGEQTSLICVDAPKTGPTVYTTYDDVCYSSGNARPQQFYLIHQQHWNVLLVASSNSMEIGILGMDEAGKWTQWLLNDNSRATLPLAGKCEETQPIGAVFNVGAMKCQIGNEFIQTPSLLVLSDHGVLCVFQAINGRPGAMDICQMLESFPDRSGETLFRIPLSMPPQQIPAVSNAPAVPTVQNPPIPKSIAALPSIPKVPGLSINPMSSTPPTTIAKPSDNPIQKPQLPLFGLPASNVTYKPPQMQATIFNQPPVQKPGINPVAPIPQQEPKPPPVTIPQPQSKPSEKLPINEETESMIAQLVREECLSLEAELQETLQGVHVQLQIGTDAEMTQMARKALDIEEFYYAIKENINTHDSEVYSLKQNLLQTWACYEEARTRFASSKDPVTKVLMQSMPLDPASQHQVDEISRMMYYIESQLSQANQCLDEQWDTFQDVLMKSSKLKMPTMESVYQSMVQHSKILQKQRYMLKHIASRIKLVRRVQTNSLLNLGNVTNDTFINLEEELSKLEIHPMPQQYNRLIERQSKLNSLKTRKMYDLFLNREVSRICSSKPYLNNSTIQLTSLLAAPLSPIGKKPSSKFDPKLINSTPKPIQELKMAKVPTQTYSPTTQQYGVPPLVQISKPTANIATNLFGSSSSLGGFGKPQLPPLPQARPLAVSSSVPKMVPVPGPGNTSPVVKPVPVASSNAFGFDRFDTPLSSSTGLTTTDAFSFAGVGTSAAKVSLSTTTASSGMSALFKTPIVPTSSMAKSGFAFSSSTTPPATLFGHGNTVPSTAASIFGFPTNASLKPSLPTEVKVTTTSGTGIPKPALLATPVVPALLNPSSKPNVFGGKPPFGVVPSMVSDISSSITATSTVTVSTSPGGIFAGAAKNFSAAGGMFDTIGAASSVGTTASAQSLNSQASAASTCEEVSKSIFDSVSSTSTNVFGAKTTASSTSLFSGGLPSNSSIVGASTMSATAFDTALPEDKSAIGSSTGPLFASVSSPASIPSGIFGGSGNITGVKPTSTTSVAVSTSTVPSSTKDFGTSTTKTAFDTNTPITAFDTLAITSAFASQPKFTSTVTPSPIVFGSTTSVAAVTSTSPPAYSAVVSSTPGFGTTVSATTAPPAFGTHGTITTTNVSTTAAPPSYGASMSVTSPPAFGSTVATTIPAATTVSAFGTGSIFASAAAAFGTSTAQSSIFGGATSTATSTSSSVFGSTNSPFAPSTAFGASPFAGAVATAPFSQNPTITTPFGQTPTTTTPFVPTPTTTSPFGSTTTTTSLFGQTTATPLFEQTTTSPFAQTVTTNSPFGSATTTTTSTAFSGGSLFGKPGQFTQGSIFGGGIPANTGSSVFGQAATVPTTNSPFATSGAFSSSLFASSAPATTSTTVFGGSNFVSSPFVSPNATAFASPPNTSSSTFSSFDGLSVGGRTASSFGQSAPAANPFVRGTEQKSPFGATSGNLFATPPSPARGTFGSGNTSFGGSAFGQQSTFGNTGFGAASPVAGAFSSGGTQSVQQSGFGSPSFQKPAFGSAPVFGQPAFGGNASFGASPTFGGGATFGSPQKVFGGGTESPNSGFGTAANAQSSTFGSIANQNTVGFGNLAQQASQAQTLPFSGGSSFTNWRN